MAPATRNPEAVAGPTPIEAVSRRDFLRVGSLSVVGLSVAESAALARSQGIHHGRSCILVLMTGGPSQLDTFDPKPDAPAEIRGPARAISTAIPGVAFSESLARLAKRADRFSLLRSLHHDAAPVHESGLQLLQTGRLVRQGLRFPSFGSVVGSAFGSRRGAPPYAVVGQVLGNVGVSSQTGQSAGFLGSAFDPTCDLADEVVQPSDTLPTKEADAIRRSYGDTPFGRRCLRARQLVEQGVRCVTVNLFDSLEAQVTWDCHARPSAPATLYDYRDTLVPQFDQALSALIDDLQHRGLYDETLLIATGEFGRTPRINDAVGREHWPGAWSALIGGCGIQGGRVIGASDSHAAEPIERPVHPGELVATIYERLGIDAATTLAIDDKTALPLVERAPIHELI